MVFAQFTNVAAGSELDTHALNSKYDLTFLRMKFVFLEDEASQNQKQINKRYLKSLVSITIKIEYIAFTKFSHGNLN
jgi:hypothetical protein